MVISGLWLKLCAMFLGGKQKKKGMMLIRILLGIQCLSPFGQFVIALR